MAKLILSLDGSVIKEVPLDKERLTIGRRPHNDLQIDNLAVSGEHALIVTILNDSFLEDLGSTNGTLVNGVPIKKHILQHKPKGIAQLLQVQLPNVVAVEENLPSLDVVKTHQQAGESRLARSGVSDNRD